MTGFSTNHPLGAKRKNLPKKKHLLNNISGKRKHIARFSTIISQNSVVIRLEGSVPSAWVSSRVNWSFFFKWWGLIRWAPQSLVLFLHQLFFLPQNFHCDPSRHLIFSLSTLLSSTCTASNAARLIQSPTIPPTYPARPGGSSPHNSYATKALKCLS